GVLVLRGAVVGHPNRASRSASRLWAVRSQRIGVTEIQPSRFAATSVPGSVGACCGPPLIHRKRRPEGEWCGSTPKAVLRRNPCAAGRRPLTPAAGQGGKF